jgi:hypothetical protein
MDLFKSNVEKMEEAVLKQREEDEKRSREIETSKFHKRYGTKKPSRRVNKHEILVSWREDL